ncbi:unnamed protein product, partial [Didymodactylos carnosus]
LQKYSRRFTTYEIEDSRYSIETSNQSACQLPVSSSITIDEAELQLKGAFTFFTEFSKETKTHIQFSLENNKICVASSTTRARHEKFTRHMPLEIIIKDEEKAKKISQLIKDFFDILDQCKISTALLEQEHVFNLKQRCEQWGLDYARLFGVDQITPLQGVERLNELLTRDYFGGSNRKGEFFKQMIWKRLCQMWLSLTRTQLSHLREAWEVGDDANNDYETSDDEDYDENGFGFNDIYNKSDEEIDLDDKYSQLPSQELDLIVSNDVKSTKSNDNCYSSNDSLSSIALSCDPITNSDNSSTPPGFSKNQLHWPVWSIENYNMTGRRMYPITLVAFENESTALCGQKVVSPYTKNKEQTHRKRLKV